MAEEWLDPRDVAWHPRRRFSLYGHDAAEARLSQAAAGGKLHHAWLLTGRRGIGKATLAYRFARHLLGGAHRPDDLVARKIAAGSHPGILVLERAIDAKNKRLKTEIAVNDARKASAFLAQTSAMGGWRIVIVDSADDLNEESANALLKILEEPPERALFLLVSHRPGLLLPTIRSRALHLPLFPLSEEETLRVLQEVSPKGSDLGQAAKLSRGSPGRALELLESKGAQAFARLIERERLPPALRREIADVFAGRDTAEEFATFCALLTEWIAERSRAKGLAGGGHALARAHEDITHSIRRTNALNLDRRQTVIDALTVLDEALKAA